MHALIISRYVKTVAVLSGGSRPSDRRGGGWGVGGGEGGYPDPEISGCWSQKNFLGLKIRGTQLL